MKFVKESIFDNIALFEYHDEPLAASSKLDNKVDYPIIRARFTKIRQLVNRQLLEHEEQRKGKKEVGYIMEIWKEGKIEKLTVRSWLHCPEIDGYDDISLDQVIASFEKKDVLDIGDKIIYSV
jgi:tRNA A37 methylthiotransferase MiaB